MRHTWSEWSLITAAVICRVRLSSGDRSLPRACTLVSSWVQEGSVEGASAAPVTRLTGQDAGPYNPRRCRGPKEDEAATRCRRPSCSGPERGARAAAGLHPLPGPFLLEHCPSFTTLAARRGHQIPCLFWTRHPLWTLFYYFCLIKASPRPDATPTVFVVCSSRHIMQRAGPHCTAAHRENFLCSRWPVNTAAIYTPPSPFLSLANYQ